MIDWTKNISFKPSRIRRMPHEKQPTSPYFGIDHHDWTEVTRELLKSHPLSGPELVDAVLESWDDIFSSRIGSGQIGVDIFPTPQIMGFLLHELIPLTLSKTNPDWRKDSTKTEKDMVYIPDDSKSIEIKTSSHAGQIFGNRSYGQQSSNGSKGKSGYYCAVNFTKWDSAMRPKVGLIRFGWIDSTDWVSQAAATGQNSTLGGLTYAHQLPVIYEDL